MKDAGPWEAGNYTEFREDMSFDEAIEVLDEGPLPVGATTVRITEGKRLSDVLVQIGDQHPGVSTEDLVAALASGAVVSKYLPPGSTNLNRVQSCIAHTHASHQFSGTTVVGSATLNFRRICNCSRSMGARNPDSVRPTSTRRMWG